MQAKGFDFFKSWFMHGFGLAICERLVIVVASDFDSDYLLNFGNL